MCIYIYGVFNEDSLVALYEEPDYAKQHAVLDNLTYRELYVQAAPPEGR